jgi:peptidoglycan hydrolase-like protein with peptidoglycan-binding domain
VKDAKRVGHGYYGKTTTAAHVNHVHFAIASVSEANALLAAVKSPARKAPPYHYPAGKPKFPGALKQGSDSDEVRTLQRRLNIRGYSPKLLENGHFAQDTTRNVKAFQRFAKLSQTGVLDLRTFNALWDLKIT